MTSQTQKVEQLIVMAQRMMAVLQADIDALQAGHPGKLRFIEPEMQRLSLLYAREVKSLNPADKETPPALRRTLRETVDKFRTMLKLHMRCLTRVRNATEGLIQAVAKDVASKRDAMRPYAPPRANSRPQSSGAMLFNQTV